MGTGNSKTITTHRDLSEATEYTSKSLDSLFLNEELGSGSGTWDTEIKALLDNYTLKSLFFTEDWVFILLDLLASEISDVDMKVARETFTEDGRNVITWLDNHPLNKLIEKPNKQMDYSTWMYLHVVEYCLMGNSIQWYAENLNQLHIIPAEQVFLDMNPDTNSLKRYVVHSHFGTQKTDSMAFSVEDIFHQRRPNPVSSWWGLSPFVPNAKALLFNRYTQDYLNSFYIKQATGQLALSLDKQVSEQAAMRLMRSFEQSYTGRRNQRRTMLLPKGVTVDQISQTIADQNIIEIVNQNREKIINILRIPKHALSLAEAGSLGSEEHKTALKFMWTSAIKPLMKKIAGAFTDFFQAKGLLAEDEKLLFDLSHIELLRDDSIRTADLAIKHLEFKTLNEVRRDLFDLPPLEGGDITPVPMPQKPNIEAAAQENDTEEISESDKSMETKDHPGDLNVKALMKKYGDWFSKNIKAIDETTKKTEKEMSEHMLGMFADMAKVSTQAFRKAFKDKKSAKTKAAEGSRRQLRKALNEAYKELDENYVEGYEKSLEPAMEAGYETNLESVFDDDLRDEIAKLGAARLEKRQAQLRSRGFDSWDMISDTTTGLITDVVDDGLSKGLSVDDIASDIVGAFAVFGLKRADTIATTESFTAVSLGKKNVLDDATSIVPDMLKVWVNVGDDRVRGNPGGKYPNSQADHWVLQGEIIAAKNRSGEDNTFSNGLRYPRDVRSNKPAHTVRCRCDMLMVRPQDLDQLSITRPGS